MQQHALHTPLQTPGTVLRVKPTYTHNHTDGIKTDGSCPRCNSYAEIVEEDKIQAIEIPFHDDNDEPVIQIMKTPPQTWYPES